MGGWRIVAGAGLALILIGGLLGIHLFQRHMIYGFDTAPTSPAAAGMPEARVAGFTATDGTPLNAWIVDPAPGRPVILSFAANGSGIGPAARALRPLLADGTGLALLQYRGQSGAEGEPSEAAFAADARRLWDELDTLIGQPVPPDRRLIHGVSLGSGVAIRLATERPAAGLIVEAGFTRLCGFFSRVWHGLPLCTLMWAERYDSIDRIGSLTLPVLILHGARDSAIPVAEAEALHQAAPAPKRLLIRPEAGHGGLRTPEMAADIRDFFPAAYAARP